MIELRKISLSLKNESVKGGYRDKDDRADVEDCPKDVVNKFGSLNADQ